MTAPNEYLAPIRARLAAATPGPWSDLDAQISHTKIDGWVDPEGRAAAKRQTAADIEFVKHTPTDTARLLAALDGVLALHRPEAVDPLWCLDADECEACSEGKGHADTVCTECRATYQHNSGDEVVSFVAWPCPTVAAVTTALEGQG